MEGRCGLARQHCGLPVHTLVEGGLAEGGHGPFDDLVFDLVPMALGDSAAVGRQWCPGIAGIFSEF